MKEDPNVAETKLTSMQKQISDALKDISPELNNSFVQVISDLHENKRISWAGTAHELREIISNTLRILAPNELITKEDWYNREKDSEGPTQKQRVKYILRQKGAGKREGDVIEQIVTIDDLIQDLVRSVYNRASDAAHRFKSREEIKKILRYFEAFISDLLS